MIPLAEARQYVLDRCRVLTPRSITLADALGCSTAEALAAPEDVPPFANSAVDGFAVRAADTANAPVELKVSARLAAGESPAGIRVEGGHAVRIMTGAAVPEGADAIVMVEDTEAVPGSEETVRIRAAVGQGDAVRVAGSDVRRGTMVFEPATELRPAHLGVLASLGYTAVPAYPKARVGVLSTGDELIEDGSPLEPGQIRESNRGMLLALAAQAGGVPVDLGLARDQEDAIAGAIQRGLERCDVILSSGGVSMGDFDLVKVVLDRLGEMRWMQIAIRPAKPFAFGLLRTGDRVVPVFGLPGNPVSSLISFELLARPALRQMMGHRMIDRPMVAAIADGELRRRPDGKQHFVRVSGRFEADGRYHVRSTGEQGSHQLAATAAADGLAVLDDGDGVRIGQVVNVILLA